MTMAPYEDWIEAVKGRCQDLDVEYAYLADQYSFISAFEDRMKPNEAVQDASEWVFG
jgi:hypothetical protein